MAGPIQEPTPGGFVTSAADELLSVASLKVGSADGHAGAAGSSYRKSFGNFGAWVIAVWYHDCPRGEVRDFRIASAISVTVCTSEPPVPTGYGNVPGTPGVMGDVGKFGGVPTPVMPDQP